FFSSFFSALSLVLLLLSLLPDDSELALSDAICRTKQDTKNNQNIAISNSFKEACCRSVVACFIDSGDSFSLLLKISRTLVIFSFNFEH
ncbi:unnamed protein product, partial [Ixodes pacificus]